MVADATVQPEAEGPANILLLGAESPTAIPGGLNRYLADLHGALASEGLGVQAIVVGDDLLSADETVSVSDPSASLVRRLLQFRKAASRAPRTIEVVDAHFALYALLPLVSTWLRRVPVVVHFQGPWADESAVARGNGGLAVRLKHLIERIVYRRAEVIVVLSECFGELVVQDYGVDPSRVVVVPPGVDLDRFRPGDRSAARARLGIPDAAFVCTAVRRLDARMGLDVLLEAWRKVQDTRDDAVLLIAGDGRERHRLEQLQCELPDPSGVRFLGRISDEELVTLYQAADVSIVPTRALEGFGLVTLESLACGTAPIVTDVGGLPDGVRDLDRSLVVPAEDSDAMADRILAAGQGVVPSAASCRAHAETFAWDVVARRHIELFRRALGARRRRVAYIGHTAELSGGELALSRTISALDEVEAHVILAEDGPLVERLRAAGATVDVLPMGERTRSLRRVRVAPRRLPIHALLDAAAYTLRLARHLRRLRPDVVHTNTLKAALYGGVAGRVARVPVVWHVRDRIAPDYLPRPAVALIRVASRLLPAVVIANSKSTLATLGGWPRSSAVVPSPVDLPLRSLGPGIVQRPFTVGLVGRLAPWKGQDLFLRAFATAFAGGEERALIVGSAMFGEDEWADSLPALASSLEIADQVDFTGFVKDVASIYQQMDVLVHASTLPEPFGQVVVEGMASGLAVVAVDAGGPAEIVTSEVDGVLVPMGDGETISTQLTRLRDDAALRRRLGCAAVERAAAYRAEHVAESVQVIYGKLAGIASTDLEVARGRSR